MKRFLLFIADISAFYFSLVLMLWLRYGEQFSNQYTIHKPAFVFIGVIWFLIFYIANLYDIQSIRNTNKFYLELFRTIAIASAISVIFFYGVPALRIAPKTNLIIFTLIFTAVDLIFRSVFNAVVVARFKKPLLIVGLNHQSEELARFLGSNPQLGYRTKCIIDLNGSTKKIDGITVGKMEDMQDIIISHKIGIVVVSPEAYQSRELIDAFYKFLKHRVTFHNLSSFYERITGRVPLGAINQMWFLENLSEGSKKTYEIIKRTGDMVGGVIFGLISLIFYPFVVIAIKISSPGPIFIRQKRLGQAGEYFTLFKFRSMIPNAEAQTGAVWASENDPRVTSVGKFLRKTRLDEIPQLWNILRGEMSFVGPRSERPEFHEKLKEQIPFYEERYLVKPGLSGWAQVKFRYGSSVEDTMEKLQYDLYYIKNRSILLDLVIILQTIRISLMQAGR